MVGLWFRVLQEPRPRNLSQLVVRWLLSQHEPWIFAWGYWYAFTLAILTTAAWQNVLVNVLIHRARLALNVEHN